MSCPCIQCSSKSESWNYIGVCRKEEKVGLDERVIPFLWYIAGSICFFIGSILAILGFINKR